MIRTIICNRAVNQHMSSSCKPKLPGAKRKPIYLLRCHSISTKQKYCTDVTRCHGDNWVRVWNCIRHASLMGWSRKNALNREGRPEGGHHPLTRIVYQ